MVKNPPANAGDVRHTGLIPRLGGPLEEKMATHSSILTWRIPWTEKPGGLQSIGSQRVGLYWSDLARTWHSCIWRVWRKAGAGVQPPAVTGKQQRQTAQGISPRRTEAETGWSAKTISSPLPSPSSVIRAMFFLRSGGSLLVCIHSGAWRTLQGAQKADNSSLIF